MMRTPTGTTVNANANASRGLLKDFRRLMPTSWRRRNIQAEKSANALTTLSVFVHDETVCESLTDQVCDWNGQLAMVLSRMHALRNQSIDIATAFPERGSAACVCVFLEVRFQNSMRRPFSAV